MNLPIIDINGPHYHKHIISSPSRTATYNPNKHNTKRWSNTDNLHTSETSFTTSMNGSMTSCNHSQSSLEHKHANSRLGASLTDKAFMIDEEEHYYESDDYESDYMVSGQGSDLDGDSGNDNESDPFAHYNSSAASLNLDDLGGLDETEHRGNVSSSSNASSKLDPMYAVPTALRYSRSGGGAGSGDDDTFVSYEGYRYNNPADGIGGGGCGHSVSSLEDATDGDESTILPTSTSIYSSSVLLSQRLRKDSLTSLDPVRIATAAAHSSIIATDDEDDSVQPSTLMLSQRLRRDSLTSLDHHGGKSVITETEDEVSLQQHPVTLPQTFLSQRLRRDSLTSMKRNGGGTGDAVSVATEESSVQLSTMMLSQRLRRDSLSSLNRGTAAAGETVTTEEASIQLQPAALMLSQRLRRDSFTSLNQNDDNEDDLFAAAPSSLLTRRLLQDSLTMARYNASGGISVLTEESFFPQPARYNASSSGGVSVLTEDSFAPQPPPAPKASEPPSVPSLLSRRLRRDYAKNGRTGGAAAGISVETEESMPFSALMSPQPRHGHRKHQDSLNLNRYNHCSGETRDSSDLSSSPLARRRLQDSLMLSRYNNSVSESVQTEDTGLSPPTSPLSRRLLQDSLVLSRYNSSGSFDAIEYNEDEVEEDDSDINLEDYTVDLIQVLRNQVENLKDKLAKEKQRVVTEQKAQHKKARRRSSIGATPSYSSLYHQASPVVDKPPQRAKARRRCSVGGYDVTPVAPPIAPSSPISSQHKKHTKARRRSSMGSSPRSLNEFFELGSPVAADKPSLSSFVPERQVAQAGLTVVTPPGNSNHSTNSAKASAAEAGIQQSLAHLTASLERLEQQKQPNGNVVLSNKFLLSVITEQVDLAKALIAAQRQDVQRDNEHLQQTLNDNAARITEIERRLLQKQNRTSAAANPIPKASRSPNRPKRRPQKEVAQSRWN